MLNQILDTLVIASSNTRVKIAIQLIIFALLLLAAMVQPEAVMAGPSWGSVGG